MKGVQQQCFELYCDLMEHIQFDISCWHWDDKQEFSILVEMKRKLVKAQDDLFKPIVKKLQDVTPKTFLPTKREFEHHKCL
jgi:hypothetical protein